MANEQSPFKKRSNPLAGMSGLGSLNDLLADEEEKKAPVVKPEPKPVVIEETPVVKETPVVVEEPKVEVKVVKPEPVKVQEPKAEPKPKAPKAAPVKKVVVVESSDESKREKYTATMEKELRIRVKIASVRKGLQFSQYIEEAVLEKLEREGQ